MATGATGGVGSGKAPSDVFEDAVPAPIDDVTPKDGVDCAVYGPACCEGMCGRRIELI